MLPNVQCLETVTLYTFCLNFSCFSWECKFDHCYYLCQKQKPPHWASMGNCMKTKEAQQSLRIWRYIQNAGLMLVLLQSPPSAAHFLWWCTMVNIFASHTLQSRLEPRVDLCLHWEGQWSRTVYLYFLISWLPHNFSGNLVNPGHLEKAHASTRRSF